MRPSIWPLIFSLIPFPFAFTAAQPGQTLLGIPSLNGFSIQSSSNANLYMLPPSAPSITISVALCSANLPLPRIFVSNATTAGPSDPESSEITFEDGVGMWTGEAPTGASIGVYVGQGAVSGSMWQYEIGIQEGDCKFWLQCGRDRINGLLFLYLNFGTVDATEPQLRLTTWTHPYQLSETHHPPKQSSSAPHFKTSPSRQHPIQTTPFRHSRLLPHSRHRSTSLRAASSS